MSQGGPLSSSGGGGGGGLPIQTITGNVGGPVGPDAMNNFNLVANTTMGITTIGNAGLNTINILGIQATTSQIGVTALSSNAQAIAGTSIDTAVTPASLAAKLGTQTQFGVAIGAGTSSALSWSAAGTNGQVLIGATGGNPAFATLTSTGGSILYTPGANALNLETSGSVAIQYDEDVGSAVPALGILQINGAHGINTAGATNVVTVAIDNTITLGDLSPVAANSNALTLTTGDAELLSGNLKLPATTLNSTAGVIKIDGNDFITNFGLTNSYVGVTAGNTTNAGLFFNTAIGYGALTAINSSGSTAIGYNALHIATSGSLNVAIGPECMTSLISGQTNVAIGYTTLQNCDSSQNTAVGAGASSGITSGNENVAVGFNAQLSGNASQTVAIGVATLATHTSGNANTAVGYLALNGLDTGASNVALGANAGLLYTTSESNNICISNQGTATDSGAIRIGTSGTHTTCFVSGIASVTTSNSELVTIDTTTGQLGSAPGLGGMVLLSSQNVSGASDVSFTSLITSTYTKYLLVFDNFITGGGSNELRLAFSVDNGSNYLATGYTAGINYSPVTVAVFANVTSTTYMPIAVGAGGGTSGYVYLFNLTRATLPYITGMSYANGSMQLIAGDNSTTGGVNAIQITPDAGTITGTFTLYGLAVV